MHSLYSRLALVLLILITAVGLAFMVMIRWVSDQYFQEVTQRLNESIALEISAEMNLIEKGVVNLKTLQHLARETMMINPTVEVYLLDPQGNILGHALENSSVVREKVDLQPVLRFLSGEEQRPLRGDDPRNLELSKIFSAAVVEADTGLEGYLYVILGGQKYDMLADQVGDTYVFGIALAAILAVLVVTLATGLFFFRSITLRLRALSGAVEKYAEDGSTQLLNDIEVSSSEDEVGMLIRSFTTMAEHIENQFQQLNEVDNQRRDLIANISHDLRTPLASMQGFVETLLLKDADLSSEERIRFLNIARKHGIQLTALVSDLFELAKLDANATELKMENFSLLDLVHDIAQEFQLVAQDKGVELIVDTPEFAPLVYADIGLMQRALQNLVANAIRYTPTGGKVRFLVAKENNLLKVSISDTGTGVAPAVLPHIFERFYRGQQNTAHSTVTEAAEQVRSSAGLGLAIVKRILDLHTITIEVKSKLSEGTRFSFSVPVAG